MTAALPRLLPPFGLAIAGFVRLRAGRFFAPVLTVAAFVYGGAISVCLLTTICLRLASAFDVPVSGAVTTFKVILSAVALAPPFAGSRFAVGVTNEAFMIVPVVLVIPIIIIPVLVGVVPVAFVVLVVCGLL